MAGVDRLERGTYVLDGVDRYRVMDPLFEGVRVVLAYRGEPVSPAYIQGISGAAFRIGGICPCAPTCTAAMDSQELPKLFGYEVAYLPLTQASIDLEVEGAKVVAQIKEQIRAGRPAVVWHAFTNAEWDVVAGFDDTRNLFLGRGTYAGQDDYAVADQVRLIKAVEICPALGAILIGEKTGTFRAQAAEIAALQVGVAHARTRKDPAKAGEWVFLEGVQCYNRWVDELRTDPKTAQTMGSRYCLGVYRSTHRAAGDFLLELAPKYPAMGDALECAARAFNTEAEALDACIPYMGWEAPESLTGEAADKAVDLLSRARDAYVEAIETIEAALMTRETLTGATEDST